MFRRPLWLTAVLAAAATLPYLTLDEQVGQTVRGQYQRLTGTAQPPTQTDPLAILNQPPESVPDAASSAVANLQQAVPLEEALRFDTTPEWVTARWTRVTSVTGDAEHLGLRVALVSGTEPTDVAGSLTYYFDQEHRVQRITLLGVTGDDTQVVAIVCGQFALRPTQTLERGLYYGGDLKSPTSSLRVANLPVMKAEASTARLQIALDLKRADVTRVKSEAELPGKILPGSYRRW
jgi:hypothetical protein